MYKETAKSGINPIIPIIIWAVSLYVFNIVWGIIQIIADYYIPLACHVIMFAATIVFGWYLISRILPEIEYELTDGKLHVTRILSKRSKLISLVATENIKGIYTNRSALKASGASKPKNYARPGCKAPKVYIAYKDNGKISSIAVNLTEKMQSAIKKSR